MWTLESSLEWGRLESLPLLPLCTPTALRIPPFFAASIKVWSFRSLHLTSCLREMPQRQSPSAKTGVSDVLVGGPLGPEMGEPHTLPGESAFLTFRLHSVWAENPAFWEGSRHEVEAFRHVLLRLSPVFLTAVTYPPPLLLPIFEEMRV